MSGLPADENIDMPLREEGRPAELFWLHLSRTTRRTLFSSYTNVLLVIVPVGIAAGNFGWPAEAVFALNILALIPLAPLIIFSVDELSPSVGHVFMEPVKPILANAVEMIVGIIALSRGQPRVARSSLLGSIVAYALLVLGCSFFIAGYDKKKLNFDKTMTNTLSSLMMAVSFSLIVPTIMHVTSEGPVSQTDSDMRILSHAISITLLIIFVSFLNFRVWSLDLNALNNHDSTVEHSRVPRADSTFTPGLYATSCILLCTLLCTILCAFHLVGSIDGLATALNINKNFISLVLIPPSGYSARCVTLAAMARRCQMNLVISSIIHSILQITMFILPLLIVLGWLPKQPLTLDFNLFEATIFFLTLIVMSSTIQDGKSNYFSGIMLIGTYALIAVAFCVRPDV
ncbi:MAG: hypothetical protein M1829_000900 [Trizodia sp. TS-e1964]|nr:MAG: hypothetical protein M1829_000900 [Trizodia sp. TS-e1964]